MKIKEKNKAIILRHKGYSLKEIADILKISKSTASLWLRNIPLGDKALQRLSGRKDFARYKAKITKKRERRILLQGIRKNSLKILNNFKETRENNKLLCSLLYWCEGEKSDNVIRFTNSDQLMVATFLYLLRSSFNIDEKKFRVCLHLHDYHDETKQKKFWSKITNIPTNQFLKVYKKKHTGKRKREGYPGCVSIRYYDHKVVKELNSLWELFAEKYGRVG